MRPLVPVLLLFIASPFVAVAGEKTPHLHVLSAGLQRRVQRGKPEQLAANLDAIAIYRKSNGHTGGTSWLLTAPDAEGNVLMMTNHHVALFERDSVVGDTVLFHPGGNTHAPVEAKVLHTVAANLEHDYALLRVRLPHSLRGLKPVSLGNPFAFEQGIAVYNPSFPRNKADEAFTPKHLQVGGTDGITIEGLEQVSLPHRSGSSGSPVFGKRSHKLIGMMNAGDDEWRAFVRPIGVILAHLDETLDQIADPLTRAQIVTLLESASP